MNEFHVPWKIYETEISAVIRTSAYDLMHFGHRSIQPFHTPESWSNRLMVALNITVQQNWCWTPSQQVSKER